MTRWAAVAAAQVAFIAAGMVFMLEVASGVGVEALWDKPDWSKARKGRLSDWYLPLTLIPVLFAPTIAGAVWADSRNRRRRR